jgi:hypothetical protein
MPSLINNDSISILTGILGNHFDTFTQNRAVKITVYKEPIQQIVNVTGNLGDFLAGVDDFNTSQTIQIPVSGQYPALIVSQNKFDVKDIFSETKVRFADGAEIIKVEKDAADFIMSGKTTSIILEDKTYNQVQKYDRRQNFLGLQYYYFKLEVTS